MKNARLFLGITFSIKRFFKKKAKIKTRQLPRLDFGLFFFLKKRLIEKIIPRKIGLVKMKPANKRWMN